MESVYETDFYAWTQEQVKLVKEQAWHHLDVLNLIEELEDLGRRERQELRNHLGLLLGHLLKALQLVETLHVKSVLTCW
ncbi:MAG TPA: hypothetical protein DEG17_26920 [Cyanobacteria bacterium UBA11149]|nr:hypothetical protein [Cyanobacteria bacterium UBA11149]